LFLQRRELLKRRMEVYYDICMLPEMYYLPES
jgi:hypothetical protein